MQHDYRMYEASLCNAHEMEMRYGIYWRDTLTFDETKEPGYGLYEEDLLRKFIEIEKILIGYNMNRHHKLFKSAYNKNKVGLKINISKTEVSYVMHGNPVREGLIIK